MLHPVSEAADLLGVGRTTVYGLLASGALTSVSVGTRRLIPHDSLERYVEQLTAEVV